MPRWNVTSPPQGFEHPQGSYRPCRRQGPLEEVGHRGRVFGGVVIPGSFLSYAFPLGRATLRGVPTHPHPLEPLCVPSLP